MNYKNNIDVKPNLKLTDEEIKSVNGFADLSDKETQALADFIYSLSNILYKTSHHE